MANYPENCFTNLLGIRGVCEPKGAITYYIDDIPAFDLSTLSDVATSDAPSGKTMGEKIIESAARLVMADIISVYDGKYKIENTLVEGCSLAHYTGNYSAGSQRGVLVRDHTHSSFATLQIDVLRARLNQSGVFNIILDDGVPEHLTAIEHEFTAGVEVQFKGIGFQTRERQVKIYLEEPGIPLAVLRGHHNSSSGCGCSGKRAAVEPISYTGLDNGVETTTAYGFIPCAFIKCDPDHLTCWLATTAPRMIGMALLYKASAIYFRQAQLSTRNNRTAGLSVDDKKNEAERYEGLYQAKLMGKGTRGLNDLVATSLGQVRDSCVVCDALLATAWSRS